MAHEENNKKVKIAFINSVMVKRDAISNIMYDMIRSLSSSTPTHYELKIFVHESDYDDPRIVRVSSISQMVSEEHYANSSIRIWNWGIFYSLFDALLLSTAKNIVYFHNVTPSKLFKDSDQIALMSKSELQIDNFFLADRNLCTRILCNSEFSLKFLADRGVEVGRLAVLHPAVTIHQPGAYEARRDHGSRAKLLYVGRFVPQKGAKDLALAFRLTSERGRMCTLTFAGSQRYSNPDYVREISSIIDSPPLRERVRFVGEVSNRDLSKLYSTAHALVVPSHHEGFCVPVAEAFSRGSYVIASNAGNLPNVVNGLGTIYPVGDVSGLADALTDFIDRFDISPAERKYGTRDGEVSVAEFEDRAVSYARSFGYDRFASTLRKIVEECATASERANEAAFVPANGGAISTPTTAKDTSLDDEAIDLRTEEMIRVLNRRAFLSASARKFLG